MNGDKTMIKQVIFFFAAIALVGCAEQEEWTMDKDLVGAWVYEDSSRLYAIEFDESNRYNQYFFVLTSATTYCDIFETGKASVYDGNLKMEGEGGRVTDIACLNFLADGSDPYKPTTVPYSVSSTSLTIGEPGEKIILVSATVDPTFWSNPMYGDWVAFMEQPNFLKARGLLKD